MKRSNTPCPTTSPRPDRPSKLARVPVAHRLRVVSVAVLLISVVPGCVTSGKHEIVVTERDELDRRSRALEQQLENARASNESLAQELDHLLDEFEDERTTRAQLEERVSSLKVAKDNLTDELSTTTSELERSKEELAKTSAEVEKLNTTYTNLVSDLESELAAGQIQIEQLKEGLRVNVSDEVLFPPGSAQLDDIGRDVLAKVANQLAGLEHHIEVQGHTDNLPIRGSLAKRFPTNWELGAARAARVARLLQEEGVTGDRLIVASFAEFRPLAPNDSGEGRAMNRRIEIRLLPIDEPVEDAEVVGVSDGVVDPSAAAAGDSEAAVPASAK